MEVGANENGRAALVDKGIRSTIGFQVEQGHLLAFARSRPNE
jgi:hypothetical protein